MSHTPAEDEAIEWLEWLYRNGGPWADRAQLLLGMLDDRDSAAEELDEVWAVVDEDTVEESGGLAGYVAELTKLEDLIDEQDWVGKTALAKLKVAIDDYVECADRRNDLLELMVAADLLEPDDRETDPLPLLRMFLPI